MGAGAPTGAERLGKLKIIESNVFVKPSHQQFSFWFGEASRFPQTHPKRVHGLDSCAVSTRLWGFSFPRWNVGASAIAK